MSFFTVNHDKLLEDFLTNTLNNEEYRLLDGTCNTSSGDDSGRWDHRVYDAQENGRKLIKVYKLHGSIRCVCNQPPVLIGTFNKVFAYNSGPFLELHHRFKRALMDEDCAAIIVCGYGFGDKGVNTRLVEWIRQSPTHRLLIIDPKESEIVHARARGAIRNVINSILPRRELNQEANSRPLDEYVHAKWLGTFLVKHLQRSVGNRPTCDTKAVTWKEVKRLVTLTEAEFLASDH